MTTFTYLDWNSYGITSPKIIELIAKPNYANASSKHFLGQQNRYRLKELNSILLKKLGLEATKNTCSFDGYKITYTANSTEANFSVLNAYERVYVSDLEHPSVRNCPHAEIIPVDGAGQMDLEYLENKLKEVEGRFLASYMLANHESEAVHAGQMDFGCPDKTKKGKFLVSYMLANHETGIINNLHDAISLTKKYGGHFHTDAVQAFGRIDLAEYLPQLEPDYITIAPYKSGGMIGVAGLIHRFPVKFGWSVERAGTCSLPLIEALVATLDLPSASNQFLERALSPQIHIIGKDLNRLPNTTCIVCKDKDELMMILDINRICVSTGAACTAGTSDQAHSIRAMGLDVDTIRISSGWSTTEADVIKCAEIINKFV